MWWAIYIYILLYTSFDYHILNLVSRGTMYVAGYICSTNLDSASSWDRVETI